VTINSEPIVVVYVLGERFSGSEVRNPDISCISVRYDEDCSIERPYMHMMRFSSLAGEYAVIVGSNPCFVLIVEKHRNEKATTT
jgi:hypothetical protein